MSTLSDFLLCERTAPFSSFAAIDFLAWGLEIRMGKIKSDTTGFYTSFYTAFYCKLCTQRAEGFLDLLSVVKSHSDGFAFGELHFLSDSWVKILHNFVSPLLSSHIVRF